MTGSQTGRNVATEERFFTTVSGDMAALCWGDTQCINDASPLVVALHGWLDNAATFALMAPVLQSQGKRVLALDLPGHGRSDWLPEGGDYYIWEAVTSVVQVLRQLPQPVHLLGHSMGAATASIIAATYPELVQSVVMLDAIGPLSTPAKQAPEQLKKGIEDVIRRAQLGRRIKYYRDIEQALQARTVKDPVLTPNCIRPVVERSLMQADQGWHWRSDPRLRNTSKVRMTEEMVQSFFNAVRCPVLVVKAEQGLIPISLFELRLDYLADARFESSAGHHHFHLDETSYMALTAKVLAFWQALPHES